MAEYCYDENDNDGKPYYYLWRMMIDNNYQGKGYGRAALDLLVKEIQASPKGKIEKLFTSAVPGEDGPIGFYEKLGFVKTGEMLDDEEGMVLVL